MTWFVGVLQFALAAWATYIGVQALKVSKRVEEDAKRARAWDEARLRLERMHELRDVVGPLVDARFGERQSEYNFVWRQQWIRTLLAMAGGARNELVGMVALSEVKFDSVDRESLNEMAEDARHELLRALEQEGDRANALRQLG